MDLSVVVPDTLGAELLPMSLAHLEAQSYPAARFEILVAGDGSIPEVTALVERFAAGAPVRIRYVQSPATGAAAARNAGVREARGRWLLFLDEDLLAGPSLVQNHLRVQEQHGGMALAVGSVALHPQVDPRAFTKHYPIYPFESPHRATTEASPTAGVYNLSMPRQVFLEAGEFDEDPNVADAEGLDLILRLREAGHSITYVPDACAYIWRQIPFDEERDRYYRYGRALYALNQKGLASEVVRELGLDRRGLCSLLTAFLRPFYEIACRSLAANTPAFIHASRQLLHQELRRGYRAVTSARR
ncbi:MAG: glycosyltransferase [Candidatus Hydrogenedentes bacterium]|nr:glycosyltransferase [Candidatus Hydrogenedentota bacterium]